MKMNSKTTGILFLLVCLFFVLFIGQWMDLGGFSKRNMDSFIEGAHGAAAPLPAIGAAPPAAAVAARNAVVAARGAAAHRNAARGAR